MKRSFLLLSAVLLEIHFGANAQGWDDWTKKKMILKNGEADLIVRVGDIDNFNQGFPKDFNVFAGKPAPAHTGNIKVIKDDPTGTDRIMVASGFTGRKAGDSYAKTSFRPNNLPQAIVIDYDLAGTNIESAVIQIFSDDFQSPLLQSELQVKLNGKRVLEWEKAINQLNQVRGVGKLITLQVPKEHIDAIKTGKVSLLIDDPASGIGEGFAIDFVRLIINPKIFYFNGIITGTITDKSTGKPLFGVKVSAGGIAESYTDKKGNFQLSGVPAGFNFITYSLSDYNTILLTSDLTAGEHKMLNAELERQQVSGAK